jgi:hypothetical protein
VADTDKSGIVVWSPHKIALVEVYAYAMAGYTLESWTTWSTNHLRARTTTFTEVSRSRILLPGDIPAYSGLYITRLAGQPQAEKLRTIHAVIGNRVFEALAHTWVSSWDRYGATLNKIALSFAPRP